MQRVETFFSGAGVGAGAEVGAGAGDGAGKGAGAGETELGEGGQKVAWRTETKRAAGSPAGKVTT